MAKEIRRLSANKKMLEERIEALDKSPVASKPLEWKNWWAEYKEKNREWLKD